MLNLNPLRKCRGDYCSYLAATELRCSKQQSVILHLRVREQHFVAYFTSNRLQCSVMSLRTDMLTLCSLVGRYIHNNLRSLRATRTRMPDCTALKRVTLLHHWENFIHFIHVIVIWHFRAAWPMEIAPRWSKKYPLAKCGSKGVSVMEQELITVSSVLRNRCANYNTLSSTEQTC